jgi:hypothetical protein
MDWAKQLLRSQEWDGIDIAELNYDAANPDYLRPDRFVPMNKQVREDFSRRSGFDPAQLFVPGSPYYHERNPKALEQFLRYREDIVTEWHRRVLGELDPIARERGMEVIVTAMDSLHSNYVQPALGVDSRRIIALMREFNFTLQVEDPVEHWAEPPERYKRFAEDYRKLVPNESRLMFDINVVSDREITGTSLPSTLARGTELARTVMAAAVSGRVAIYAEHTVERQDWPIVGSALAQPAQVIVQGSTVQVDSPLPVFLKSPKDTAYSVDGQRWPPVSGGMLIPSGDHHVSAGVRGLQPLGAQLVGLQGLSCDLLEARLLSVGLALRYKSPGRAAVVISRRPQGISVDGQAVQIPVEGDGDQWIILAPRGEHRLDITMLNRADLTVNWSSWILSSLLALIGAIVTLRMLWFYLQLRTSPPSQWRRLEG